MDEDTEKRVMINHCTYICSRGLTTHKINPSLSLSSFCYPLSPPPSFLLFLDFFLISVLTTLSIWGKETDSSQSMRDPNSQFKLLPHKVQTYIWLQGFISETLSFVIYSKLR